ncbi:MAG: CHAT domain-containing protein [Bacteroidota bacterium]
MPSATPIILLAFANDREGNFLRNIAAEQQAISRALREAERQKLCEVLVLADASLDDIIQTFKEERGRISIFHYGGHADGDALHLSSESGGEAQIDGQSFANFLGQQANLELVFLNGCATLAQKEFLLEAGVKRVIITDQAINDNGAKQFAAQFYESLGTGLAIAKSFEEASATTVLKESGQTRNLYWEAPSVNARPELPWQFHQHSNLQASWQLRAATAPPTASDQTDSKPKWLYYVLGGMLLLALGFGGRTLYSTMNKKLPPPEKVENLPAWYEFDNLISFTGKVSDQKDKAVDEAKVEVENLKDLQYAASREIDAHLGSFVLQLSPKQLGKKEADSVRFIISKPGYYKTVQWMQVAQLWDQRDDLHFLLLEKDQAQSDGSKPTDPATKDEVIINTRISDLLQKNRTEVVLKQLKVSSSLSYTPTTQDPKIDYISPNTTSLKLKMVKLTIKMGNRMAKTKWVVTVNDKEVNPATDGESWSFSILSSKETAVIKFKYRTACRFIKLVPNSDKKLDFQQDFKNCN